MYIVRTTVPTENRKEDVTMTVQKLGKIIAIVGILLILGAFGAAECETITFARFLVALVVRIALTLFGLYLSHYEEPDEYLEEIEVD